MFSKNNKVNFTMSLNKFSDVDTGYTLNLDIGADEIKANQISTTNIDVTTINGAPYIPGGGGGGVTNPLSANLALGGFSIIEPLTAASPSLNIDQLDPAKKIDLKVAGIPKVVVKSGEVELKTGLNMDNNNLSNVLNINSGTTINLNPTSVVNINGDVDMVSNRIIGVPEIVGDGSNMTIQNGGTVSILLDQATNKLVLPNNNLDMNNNDIDNVNRVISSGVLSLESSGGSSQRIEMDGNFITFFNNTITPSITPSGIDLNNGDLNSANTVKSSTDLQLQAGNNTGIIIENAPSDTIIFQKSTNHNGNVLDNVGVGAIQNIVNCDSINGFTPQGGIFAGTSDSLTLTNSTAEQSILPTSFVGTLTVPANGFKVGDSFHCVLAGDFDSKNGDTLTIRLKGGPSSTVILGTLVVPLNASSASSFEIEVDFQLRNIGGAGVADICSNFDFTYNQSGGGGAFVGERSVSQNNTTFDTTVDNTLQITAQFSSTSSANSIKTVVSKLTKDY